MVENFIKVYISETILGHRTTMKYAAGNTTNTNISLDKIKATDKSRFWRRNKMNALTWFVRFSLSVH